MTAEDYRRYFCAWTRNDQIVYEEYFSLVSDVGSDPHQPQPRPCRSGLDQLLMYGSFTLKLLLLVVGSGLLLQRLKQTCRKQERPETEEAPQYENGTWLQRVEGAGSDPGGAGCQITVVNRV
ncbi:uncharacterized protein LOC121517167 isoform X1 [Cheilinus undulatus]|uniref:uncharacterized protein LOC121517167 isoform X1 n=1 Tax=Cheilinus undulatus TaxID=241271 RepID=UPI001BD22AF1|nr:uncharacterized protein LOC121517167 isoform X1 [Cheilinus undulatus]